MKTPPGWLVRIGLKTLCLRTHKSPLKTLSLHMKTQANLKLGLKTHIRPDPSCFRLHMGVLAFFTKGRGGRALISKAILEVISAIFQNKFAPLWLFLVRKYRFWYYYMKYSHFYEILLFQMFLIFGNALFLICQVHSWLLTIELTYRALNLEYSILHWFYIINIR